MLLALGFCLLSALPIELLLALCFFLLASSLLLLALGLCPLLTLCFLLLLPSGILLLSDNICPLPALRLFGGLFEFVFQLLETLNPRAVHTARVSLQACYFTLDLFFCPAGGRSFSPVALGGLLESQLFFPLPARLLITVTSLALRIIARLILFAPA